MTKILVVDDQAQNRYMLEVLLKGYGYEVVSASNGAEALKRASENLPDVIVTDILMPVMDGFALCRQWKAAETLKGIPFIFYTATYTDPKDEQFALGLGADRYILKPAQPQVLAQVVSEVLEEARTRRPHSLRQLLAEEAEFLREHNEVLFRKLEHKMAVLETEIAERRRIEDRLRQSEKMEAIGLLAGGVAHDFNNLLGVIVGHGDLLSLTLPKGHPARSHVEMIQSAAQRGAGLTRQLLAFSRHQVVEPTRLDVGVIAQAVEKMLRRVIRENVELVARCEPGLWPVIADSGQIEQVIMNLAINARDAMPSGGRLVIETRNAELAETQAGADPRPSRQVVALAVSDTGVGMTAETRARLFEPFFTTKPVGKGTGLGLTTVHEIVKQSGGWIDVASEVDHGTTFTVYLPRAPEATVEVAPILRKEDDGKAPRGSETILLVEDEEALSVVMTEVLEEAGYTVIHTESPNDAVKRVESYPGTVHLLLSDVVMPEMNGPQLAARIRSTRPDVRILFMSGYPDDALGLASRELVRRIEKPFSQDLLLRAVRKALDVPVPSAGGGENKKPKLG